MRRALVVGLWMLPAVLAPAQPAAAQPERLRNGQVRMVAAGPGALERTLGDLVRAQTGPAWIGWSAPASGEHNACCHDGSDRGREGCAGCRLEGSGRAFSVSDGQAAAVTLEGQRRLRVLLRAEQGQAVRVRSFSDDCWLDAGGLPFLWLGERAGAESVRALEPFARAGGKPADAAVAAIAFHEDPAADAALSALSAAGQPEKVRRSAVFWLGNARGAAGARALVPLMRGPDAAGFRKHVVFALSQSREAEALQALLDSARSDRSSEVRGQALFWLAQRAGRKAAEAITRAIEDDPDTEVKKKAVFALSQLPKDEGVPLLIRAARTNRNPAVRKQALFWLGQTNDPRALAFIEEVLLSGAPAR